MYGLDYVALRYFNVYGPRMDIYGVYTEVLVRWMERIEAGRAAADPRRRLARRWTSSRCNDVARANVLAAATPHVGRGLQRRQRHLDQPGRAGRRPVSKVMGAPRARARARPRAGHQRRALAAGRHHQGPRPARLHRRRIPLEAGLADLVDWWRAAGASSRTCPVMNEPALPGPWDGLVVICATTPWIGHRLLDQAVARSSSRFAPVLYVDPPVSVVRRGDRRGAARRGPPCSCSQPGLARLTPTAPPLHQRPGVKPLSLAVTRRALARAVASLGSPRSGRDRPVAQPAVRRLR